MRYFSRLRNFLVITLTALAVSACGIYSFTGTSIQPDVSTITLNFFEYNAQRVNPTLSNDLTEALKEQFRRSTSLEQVELDGDLEISGVVTSYDIQAAAITADEVAAQNRLTVTVSITFTNRKYPEDDLEQSFTQFAEYDSNLSLDAVEASLCVDIVDKLVEDIFNATVAQW